MNTTIKRGLIEVHQFYEGDVPIILYPDKKKYRNVPFLVNKHRDLELLFVRDGKIEMHLDDAVFTATAGEIIVANCNVLHNIVPITETVLYDCLLIDKEFCCRYGFEIDKNHIQEIIENSDLFNCINRIKQFMDDIDSRFRVAEVTAETLKILLTLFRQYIVAVEDKSTYGNREMLEKGLEYIHEHFSDPIDVDAVADYSGYSKFYFCRRFKEITGCTVNTYINMQRVSHAKELLSRYGSHVSEVAAECGFNSVPYFSQIFKKYVRSSPGEYKKNIKKPRQ